MKLRRPHISGLFSATLLACSLFNVAHARSPKDGDTTPRSQSVTKPTAQTKQPAKKKADADAARKARELRDATAALREVADAARSFDDLYYCVQMQSEAADALWSFDEQAARAILRRAWEATTAPGAEDKLRDPDDTDASSPDAFEALLYARRIVIKAAAKHDPRLADSFMKDFEHDLAARSTAQRGGGTDSTPQGEQPDGSNSSQRKERSLSPAGFQRLAVADQLLAEGDFKSAADTAAPVVSEGPTQMLLAFIISLRAQDAQDADALYLRLIEATRADATTDANDVILLSSPVVSPTLFTHVTSDGSATFAFVGRIGDGEKLAPVPMQVRGAFYDTAASVLLRPPSSGAGGQQEGETAAFYYAIGHLLPFFERDAPQYAPALNARMAALAPELAPGLRDSLASKMDVSSLSPKNSVDPLADEMDEVSRATSATERDSARLNVVTVAMRRKLWDRARAAAAEIEDDETRRAARRVISIYQVMDTSHAFDSDDGDSSERAADFVRAADVPPGVRAAGLAQAAELAARAGRQARARELLTEASNYAAQTDRGRARVTALSLVLLSAARADAPRVWEFLPAVVSAGNEVDDLAYGALVFEFSLGPKGKEFSLEVPDYPSEPSLNRVFTAAAKIDATRALAAARNFKDEEVRASALLAAARAAIERSSGAKSAGAR